MDKLYRALENAWLKVLHLHQQRKLSTRLAALSIGVQRIYEAKRVRGLFP